MANEITESRIDALKKEIVAAHVAGIDSVKSGINSFILAGQKLCELKDALPHGEFLPYVNVNFPFSERTAYKYMDLFKYRFQLFADGNSARTGDFQLTDIYAEVERLKLEDKRKEDEAARERVAEYNRTGDKPEGWRRGTDDRLAATLSVSTPEDVLRRNREKAREAAAQWDNVRRGGASYDEEGFPDYDAADWNDGDAAIDEPRTARKQPAPKQGGGNAREWLSAFKAQDKRLPAGLLESLASCIAGLGDDDERAFLCRSIAEACEGVASWIHFKNARRQ